MLPFPRSLQIAEAGESFTKQQFLTSTTPNFPIAIAEAERVIVHRARELFQQSGNNFKEQQALDDALNALRVLRSIERRNRMRNASNNLRRGQLLA